MNTMAKNLDELETLDGAIHIFKSLCDQRLYLFAALVNTFKEDSWKTHTLSDGYPCFGGEWFIVGIDTPEGPYTYRCENEHWDLFKCKEIDRAPEWDGHDDRDIARILSLEK